MAEEQNALVTPNIEDLMSRVDSRFTLVTLASRRARQINSYLTSSARVSARRSLLR